MVKVSLCLRFISYFNYLLQLWTFIDFILQQVTIFLLLLVIIFLLLNKLRVLTHSACNSERLQALIALEFTHAIELREWQFDFNLQCFV